MVKDQRHRRPYPKHKKREMTARWKADVIHWMKREDLSIPKVAALLGADRKAVWQMLQPGQNTSSLVDPICELAGIDPPLVAARKDELDRVVEVISEEDRPRAAAILRAALGDRLTRG